MNKAVKQLDFIQAAKYRDEMFELEKLIDMKSQKAY
jgi:excinuclease UvrABC nuclease subunit